MVKDGRASDSGLNEGILKDERPTLGIEKIGTAVDVGKGPMIGRRKEPTLGEVVGISSMLGAGMDNGGSGMILDSPVDCSVSEGVGVIPECRLKEA